MKQPDLNECHCPFCGGAGPQLEHQHGITFVLCDGCGAVVSFRPNVTGRAAIAAYAKRAPQRELAS